MSFADKTLQCADCGNSFTFAADEQELFASRGYMNEPKRCPPCRAARKAQRGGGNTEYRSRTQLFPATCAECGKETEVPFEPRAGRPVYCRDCYNRVKLNR